MRYRLAMTALATWILGCLLGSYGLQPLSLWMLLPIFLTLLLLRFSQLRPYALGTLCLFLGFTYAHTWRRFHWRSVELGKTTVQGTVIAPPDNRPKSLYLTVQTQEPLGANILQEPAP
jgi:hypothetical protein